MDPNARKPGDPGTTDESGKHLTPDSVLLEEAREEREKENEVKESEVNQESEYWDLTVPELRSLLEDQELSVEGNKPDLVERLEDADRAKQE